MSNFWEEREKRKIEVGVREGHFIHEPVVYCPHCGFEQQDYWESVPAAESGYEPMNCEKCQEEFFVEAVIMYNSRKYKERY